MLAVVYFLHYFSVCECMCFCVSMCFFSFSFGSVFCCFVPILLFFCLFHLSFETPACFLIRERKIYGLDLGGWEEGDYLRGVEGGETLIRIH